MSLVKKFLTVGFSTLGSRLFGFVRDMLMAAALGTGPVADVFYAAFRFPNLFRRLFAEGAFNLAFVPLFSKEIETHGDEGAKAFASEVFGVLFSALLILTIAMELAMPLLVRFVIAPGFADDADKLSLTVRLTAIMFPYLSFMSLTAMMAGMLNSLRRYFAAAIAPVFLNLVLIIALAYAWWEGADAVATAHVLAWGVLAGGAAQLAVVFFDVRRAGMVFSVHKPKLTPKVKRLLYLAVPAAITGGVTQINQLVGQAIASGKEGAIASLAYADRIYQLPLGIFGIAVGVVLLPELSRALKGGHAREAESIQNRSVEFVLFLTLPAAAGIWALSEEIIRVLFERGDFGPASTAVVAPILAVYGFGLPGFVLLKTFQPGFYAREDSKTPMRYTVIAMGLNVVLAFTLFPIFFERGIAMAEIASGWLNTVLLGGTLFYKGNFKPGLQLFSRGARIIFCAVLMGLAVRYLSTFAESWLVPSAPFYKQGAALAALIAVAVTIYFPLTFITGAVDRELLMKSLKGRKKA
ncbi:murein biosynthesis integral membrane protein MurJ [Rhizobium sp. L1K21]|uniref:murein biosynthesis integral membrane protein MurJ n=1 Tax=Rhizobium sp. L1K21 TaxID=2954933 RepID=UPI0020938912|nr:murein biosynthesis integral membrane protein MurJ [Rhizobium sp. L1K21]MCO6187373.1 murein biosynthesis integral membrane protein MurJ [Rhizobium sp. L1K21]